MVGTILILTVLTVGTVGDIMIRFMALQTMAMVDIIIAGRITARLDMDFMDLHTDIMEIMGRLTVTITDTTAITMVIMATDITTIIFPAALQDVAVWQTTTLI